MAKSYEATIPFFNEPMKVCCDGNCRKAWGINNRPKVQLSADVDDFAWLADDELGNAPADPGTYEGGDAKPHGPSSFPNKWCVRECERCEKSAVGESHLPISPRDFSVRVFNMPQGPAKTPNAVG